SGLSSRFQLAVSLFENLFVFPVQLICRSDISYGAVEANLVVMLDESPHHLPGILKIQEYAWPNTFLFQRAVPSLDFPITLRIIRRCPDVSQTAHRICLMPGPLRPFIFKFRKFEICLQPSTN
ncbi:MAG: hypothetical protein ACD_19C00377G0001, partial [uncultured bacterium]